MTLPIPIRIVMWWSYVVIAVSLVSTKTLAANGVTPGAAAASCEERCIGAGHCCTGNISSCQHPSCYMGCEIAVQLKTETQCNQTCNSTREAMRKYVTANPNVGNMSKPEECTLTVGNQVYQMCGDCAQRWLDPTTLSPVVLPGQQPWWPPGFNLPSCGSCDALETECELGCVLAFNPTLAPKPPKPQPPPDTPLPPAPWPESDSVLNFSATHSSHMVLQQSPAQASVYGHVGTVRSGTVAVVVTVTGGADMYKVNAVVTNGRWKAVLRPTNATSSTSSAYTITATCASGCTGTVSLDDVVFGDVWYCSGQSNMWLNLQYTYARNKSFAALAAGSYNNIRVMAGDSQSQGLNPAVPPTAPWMLAKDAALAGKLDVFSAACYYFGEGLTDQLKSASMVVPPIGLINTAIGGSMIEEWVTNEVAATCFGADVATHNHELWDVNIRPFLQMTMKGFLFYQGENNCGTLHGNSFNKAGYGCLMPAMIKLWRDEFSQAGATDPLAPFGVVSISTSDSEGSADLASFRWSQTGNYGRMNNEIMPNTFMAHAYDLQDPWAYCGNECLPHCATSDPLYDCRTKFYMGPGLHPRLKQPVGHRLAVAALGPAYGIPKSGEGPTIDGCSLVGDALTITFDALKLNGVNMTVRKYNTSNPSRSALFVLVNDSWVGCNIMLSSSGSGYTIDVDLSPLNGTVPTAVRYAWGDKNSPNGKDVDCCDAADHPSEECIPASCPIMTVDERVIFGGLPANPFLAKIVNGKCLCPSPQDCSN
eukprot:m.9603 g.9603  ORF g.9603 m.9603 type:complete len:763 (+) comp7821_c0_seq1:110-2398(+)